MDKIQIFIYFAIYLLGSFEFSVLWIVLFVLLSMYRYDQATQVSRDERVVVFQSLAEDIPSIGSYPDVERAEWINNVLKTLWPKIKDYGERKLRDIQPKINKQKMLKNLKIERVDVGEVVRFHCTLIA